MKALLLLAVLAAPVSATVCTTYNYTLLTQEGRGVMIKDNVTTKCEYYETSKGKHFVCPVGYETYQHLIQGNTVSTVISDEFSQLVTSVEVQLCQ